MGGGGICECQNLEGSSVFHFAGMTGLGFSSHRQPPPKSPT